MFQCIKCHQDFIKKQGLDYHILHNVCDKLADKICSNCGHQFSTKAMLQYHVNHAVCGPIQPKVKLSLKKTYDNCTREELILKVTILEAEKKLLADNPKTVNNNQINNGQINNNQSNIIFPE